MDKGIEIMKKWAEHTQRHEDGLKEAKRADDKIAYAVEAIKALETKPGQWGLSPEKPELIVVMNDKVYKAIYRGTERLDVTVQDAAIVIPRPEGVPVG